MRVYSRWGLPNKLFTFQIHLYIPNTSPYLFGDQGYKSSGQREGVSNMGKDNKIWFVLVNGNFSLLTIEIHCSIQIHDVFRRLQIFMGVENIGVVGKQIKV